ncbi:hypothetical protein Nepgr_018009 [Nepenthes gracilis]|uniref:Uncharacterized protein n=1 Tax=Nepenthes gracilis TaxID=150966 RepID=A0AAD3XT27_NEPGR|nr:hypothetical protein Nepgr_018009 [Nepenthes gracilis]
MVVEALLDSENRVIDSDLDDVSSQSTKEWNDEDIANDPMYFALWCLLGGDDSRAYFKSIIKNQHGFLLDFFELYWNDVTKSTKDKFRSLFPLKEDFLNCPSGAYFETLRLLNSKSSTQDVSALHHFRKATHQNQDAITGSATPAVASAKSAANYRCIIYLLSKTVGQSRQLTAWSTSTTAPTAILHSPTKVESIYTINMHLPLAISQLQHRQRSSNIKCSYNTDQEIQHKTAFPSCRQQ